MVTLCAAGFNGHGQLTKPHGTPAPQDRLQFEAIARGDSIEVLRAGWSSTILRTKETVRLIGLYGDNTCQDLTLPLSFKIKGTFACDAPSHVGFTSSDGRLYLLQDDGEQLSLLPQGDEDSPKLSHVAVTATGHTCISFLQSPASQLIHLLQFSTFPAFLAWFRDPSSSSRGDDYAHHSIRGRVAQLEAGAAHFIVRTESGDLYSWTTDARHHRCLGRGLSDGTPATTPAPVEALGGIVVAKVAAGSWMTVALSGDRDAYVWGREKTQEQQQTMAVLPLPGEDVRLVDVAEGAEVLDVAAGSGHLLILTAARTLMGVGENFNGQLSLGQGEQEKVAHMNDWTEVKLTEKGKVTRIWAGDSTSFALLEDS